MTWSTRVRMAGSSLGPTEPLVPGSPHYTGGIGAVVAGSESDETDAAMAQCARATRRHLRTRPELLLPRRWTVSANGHPSPTQIRSRLSHPVIDADGHWLEYGSVFGEQIRKV